MQSILDQTIYEICCGMDVHRDYVVACIIKTRNLLAPGRNQKGIEKETRVFKTFLDDLKQLRNRLESENCIHVAMESTGIYWFPIYDALEGACDNKMEIIVTNARHMRNVPGKKTDIKDADWIAILLRAGLLSGSFIQPLEVWELRQLTRYRKNVVEDIGTQKNRIEKALQQAGFKLSTFLSDVFGVSGRNLLRVLVRKGRLTPDGVENEKKRISSVKKEEIKLSVNGLLSDHQRHFLQLQLNLLDELQVHPAVIEQSISVLSSKFENEIARLDTIPGIAVTSATAIIAEIGTDRSRFPTAEHFCKWAGLAPGDNESVSKKKYPYHFWQYLYKRLNLRMRLVYRPYARFLFV